MKIVLFERYGCVDSISGLYAVKRCPLQEPTAGECEKLGNLSSSQVFTDTVEFRLDTPPSLVTGRSNSDGQISTLVTEQLFRKSQNFHNSYWKILANLCQFFGIFDDFLVKISGSGVQILKIFVCGALKSLTKSLQRVLKYQNFRACGGLTATQAKFLAVSERC